MPRYRLQNIPAGAVEIRADAGTDGPADLAHWADQASRKGRLVCVIDHDGLFVALDLAGADHAGNWDAEKRNYTAPCLVIECESGSADGAADDFRKSFTVRALSEDESTERMDAWVNEKYAGKSRRESRTVKVQVRSVMYRRDRPHTPPTPHALNEYISDRLYLTPTGHSPSVVINVPIEVGSQAENWAEIVK